MDDLDALLTHLEELLESLQEFDEPIQEQVFDLLDGIDVLHRMALTHLGDALSDQVDLNELRQAHPAISWLFDAYAVGVDERAAAEQALEEIRPYIHSHGGEVEILEVQDGVVHVRMSGACAGCTASAVTLREGVESSLREHFPGFMHLTVEDDEAEPHAPPGPTLVQLQSGPPPGFE
ncbi:MAG: NifU family protein [Actinomycetota bacterium]|nr:NifU family protein [Actinomycetota bacterium]